MFQFSYVTGLEHGGATPAKALGKKALDGELSERANPSPFRAFLGVSFAPVLDGESCGSEERKRAAME